MTKYFKVGFYCILELSLSLFVGLVWGFFIYIAGDETISSFYGFADFFFLLASFCFTGSSGDS